MLRAHDPTASAGFPTSHQTRAAKRLGLTQPYLARLMKNLQVRPED